MNRYCSIHLDPLYWSFFCLPTWSHANYEGCHLSFFDSCFLFLSCGDGLKTSLRVTRSWMTFRSLKCIIFGDARSLYGLCRAIGSKKFTAASWKNYGNCFKKIVPSTRRKVDRYEIVYWLWWIYNIIETHYEFGYNFFCTDLYYSIVLGRDPQYSNHMWIHVQYDVSAV